MLINSFDKTVSINCTYNIPEKYNELYSVLKNTSGQIARGSGLSYCAASMAAESNSIDFKNFNRIIQFDKNEGTIEVEAGIEIGNLSNFLLKHHYILPALPGYPSITIGGCVAFNVHGKSQYKTGNFKDWVVALQLYNYTTGLVNCNSTENSELFYHTIGGMGLTGVIISVKLKLKKIDGNILKVKTIKTKNIKETVQIMLKEEENQDYIYSWNNFNKKGNHFGSGIVYLEKHTTENNELKIISYKNKLSKMWRLALFHNALIIKLMTFIYENLNRLSKRQKSSPIEKNLFPIYGKEIYYKLMGKKGFREYQVIFPLENWEFAVEKIRNVIAEMKIAVTLGSLKIFKGEQHNLSFSGSGLCVVVDVPNTDKSVQFFEKLDNITVQYNGIVNLCKDSRIPVDLVSNTFSGYHDFKNFIKKIDPENVYQSELKTRLCL